MPPGVGCHSRGANRFCNFEEEDDSGNICGEKEILNNQVFVKGNVMWHHKSPFMVVNATGIDEGGDGKQQKISPSRNEVAMHLQWPELCGCSQPTTSWGIGDAGHLRLRECDAKECPFQATVSQSVDLLLP